MSVKSRLQDLQKHIAQHATSYLPVTIICVSKGVSLEKMQEAYHAGIRHFGESRLQEALLKKEKMPSDVVWHYIGPIQSNKAKEIARHFDVIHSLASLKVAHIFSDVAQKANRLLSCFIQVNVTHNINQQGVLLQDLPHILPLIQSLPGLRIEGLMVIAPHASDTEKIRNSFHSLFLLSKQYSLPFLSMGMSQDYTIALEEGSTHLRLGSYFFSN